MAMPYMHTHTQSECHIPFFNFHIEYCALIGILILPIIFNNQMEIN